MHQDQDVDFALGDQICRNNSFAEGRGCRKDTILMGQQRISGKLLFVAQTALESYPNRLAGTGLVIDLIDCVGLFQ